MIPRPHPGDYADFFAGYVARVPDGDVLAGLADQGRRMAADVRAVGEARGDYSYADHKWSIKRLLLHVADGERMFAYRAMCVARGDAQELPSFDENAYAAEDGSATRTLASIVEEYASVRAATLTLFRGLDAAAWRRRGRASGNPVTVAALPWIMLGHDLHHHAVLTERYGVTPG
ncbi:MAG: DinB family protein [Planctomycetota bacterium]|nr:DinB family protein [Planctomycetota bacterium]MEC9048791.1 DinB family protein [Planctomycetota bacterium]